MFIAALVGSFRPYFQSEFFKKLVSCMTGPGARHHYFYWSTVTEVTFAIVVTQRE